jgi:hypothetical protein
MIPQAITNTGPYAGLWSDLKSMRHALERATKAKTMSDIAELDRTRLEALAKFLRTELDPKPVGEYEFLSLTSNEPRYSLDVDLRQLLKALPEFEQWHRAGKLAFKEKTEKLIDALEDYIKKLTGNLFPKNPPGEEFKILHAVLSELLLRTETALLG